MPRRSSIITPHCRILIFNLPSSAPRARLHFSETVSKPEIRAFPLLIHFYLDDRHNEEQDTGLLVIVLTTTYLLSIFDPLPMRCARVHSKKTLANVIREWDLV
ncbi:hypothetical protein BOTBODRAFT_412853 [Botryobasidium botryosum FD-172 SS1]|uniref:Uncharacterized protein n=1 Tax=Botryobasidium botryosum (strain FD-172 SS1) TaxID=930990 RepID=A0A067MLX9_BOTB1|nr:hypothetical protein BOTBODRAFT_412853 [Botryobasidium botryosum FD-172 SS1]